MTKAEKEQMSLEIQDEVYSIAKEAGERIQERVLSLTALSDQERWLVYSRVISLLFGHHYGMSVKAADESIAKLEQPRSDGGEE